MKSSWLEPPVDDVELDEELEEFDELVDELELDELEELELDELAPGSSGDCEAPQAASMHTLNIGSDALYFSENVILSGPS